MDFVLCFVFAYVRRFLRVKQRDRNKDQTFSDPSNCVSFSFVFLCLFFFLNLDSKETMRSGLITVLKTVQVNYGSNSSLLFWHRSVLKLKRTMIVRDSRFSWSDHTVQFRFQNNAHKLKLFKYSFFFFLVVVVVVGGESAFWV